MNPDNTGFRNSSCWPKHYKKFKNSAHLRYRGSNILIPAYIYFSSTILVFTGKAVLNCVAKLYQQNKCYPFRNSETTDSRESVSSLNGSMLSLSGKQPRCQAFLAQQIYVGSCKPSSICCGRSEGLIPHWLIQTLQ